MRIRKLLQAFGAVLLAQFPLAHAQVLPEATSPALNRIAARGAVYLGYREAAMPFSYLTTTGGMPTGYIWELCTGLVKSIEARVGKPLKIVPVASNENSRIMLMKTGVIDFDCGASVNSVARQKQVGFSDNVYFSELKFLVRGDSAFNTFEQLAGKRIVVPAGGIVERQLKQSALASNIVFQMMLAETEVEAVAMLAKGEVDAFAGEDVLLAAQSALHAGSFRLLEKSLSSEPYAIMMSKDDPVLKQLVDETLQGQMQRGELSALYDKWFMGPLPPKGITLGLPMSEALKAAIAKPSDKPVN